MAVTGDRLLLGGSLIFFIGMKLKRIRNLGEEVKSTIVADYAEKREDGYRRWTLVQLAEKYEICWESIVKIVKNAGGNLRQSGARRQSIPSARVMKILRDASEPGSTYEEVGMRNPRYVKENGKIVPRPLSRQRIKQIVDHWTKIRGFKLRERGFRVGEMLYWGGGHLLEVIRYDDDKKGAVHDHSTGKAIDPFYWVQGMRLRPKRIKEHLRN